MSEKHTLPHNLGFKKVPWYKYPERKKERDDRWWKLDEYYIGYSGITDEYSLYGTNVKEGWLAWGEKDSSEEQRLIDYMTPILKKKNRMSSIESILT